MVDEPTPTPPTEGHNFWTGVAEAAHDKLAHKLDARRKAHLADVLEHFEGDLAPTLAPLFAAALEHPDTPPEIRDLLGALAEPQHFTTALLLGIAAAGILQPVLAAVLAPTVQAISNTAWHGAATTTGNPATIHISPVEASVAVLKGVFDQAHGASIAAYSGVNELDFDHLVQIAGNAIGFHDALLLDRRGQLGNITLDDVLHYSNVNPRFYDAAKNLRYSPIPAAEVITASLKGHIDDDTARTWLNYAGLNPINFETLRASAGRPPGLEQMLHLRNRNKATTQDVTDAVRQSDINDHYLPFILELGTYIPPPRSIVPMLRAKGIDEARARVLLTENGVRPEDQDAFIAEAQTSTATHGKDLTEGLIVRMYTGRFIDRPTAIARLEALGYDATESTTLVDYADSARHEQQVTAAVRMVGTRYVAWRLDKNQATAFLGDAGVAAAAQHDLFTIWDIERAAAAPNLTVAQWQGALRRGLVTHADFVTKLTAFGYDATEIDLLAGLAFPPPARPRAATTKNLSVAQVTKLFQQGVITAQVALADLQMLGYSLTESQQLLSLATTTPRTRALTEPQVIKLLKAGTIGRPEAVEDLTALGFNTVQIGELLTNAGFPAGP